MEDDTLGIIAQICGILSFVIALISLRTSCKNKKDISHIKQIIKINSPDTKISITGDGNMAAGRNINNNE